MVETVSKTFFKRNGILDFSCAYEHIGSPIEGLYPVYSKTNMGFVDSDGRIVIPMIYDTDYAIQANHGYIRLSKNHKYGIFSLKLHIVVIDFYWDKINLDDMSDNGMIPVMKNSKWGFISLKNKHFAIDSGFDAVGPFKDGFASAKQNELWGIINARGTWVVPPISLIETSFVDDFAIVYQGKEIIYHMEDGGRMEIAEPNCMLISKKGKIFEAGHKWIYRSGPNTFVFQEGINSNNDSVKLPSKRFVRLDNEYDGKFLVIEDGHYVNGWIDNKTGAYCKLVPSAFDQRFKYHTHAALIDNTMGVTFYLVDGSGQKCDIKKRELRAIQAEVWSKMVIPA